MKRILILALLVLFQTGCKKQCICEYNQAPPLRHVVICWLDDPALGPSLIEKAAVLSQIPGVIGVEGGTMVPSNRAIVDSTYHIALTITFKSKEDLAPYITHPIHVDYVKTHLKPHLKKVIIYDYQL